MNEAGFLKSNLLNKIIFVSSALLCLTPLVDPPIALLLGFILAQVIGNPIEKYTRTMTQVLLQSSVVGLGFGMNLAEVIQVSKQGFVLTVCSIALTLIAGIVVGKILTVNKKTSWLISFGTAICGGSAIAAISPIIEAKDDETSVSLAIIFLLNAIALIIFPWIGHYFVLNQHQFGTWAAIAIHDTSSVIGAAQKYGTDALRIATTVKLERALWIIPVSLTTAIAYNRKKWKVHFPFFIFLFIAAMVANTFIPQLQRVDSIIVIVAKKGLTLALFFIGAGLNKAIWKAVNPRPLILGIILWLLISVSSLLIVLNTL